MKYTARIIRKRLGFTLIELLVVFSVITIMSSVGFASFVSYSNRQIVVQAVAHLEQTINLARFNASSSVKPASCGIDELSAYRVNFCHTLGVCSSPTADYEMTVVCGGSESIQEARNLPDNVNMQDVSGGSGDCRTLTFRILSGIAEGTPCEIDLAGYNNTVRLSIDDLGHANY